MYNAVFLSVVTLIYMGPALVNGGPFFYFDSAAYIENVAKAVAKLWPGIPDVLADAGSTAADAAFDQGQDDNIVYSGRSVYYGALAYTGWITTIWVPVVAQCLTLAWLTKELTQRLFETNWRQVTILLAVGLTLGTSAGAFAGLVMPDIWSGLAVLALAVLWSPGYLLTRRAQIILLAILAFAVLAHSSHLALIAVLFAGCLLVRPFLATSLRPQPAALVIPMLALVIGVTGSLAFTKVVAVTYGQPPLSRPFMTAHLVDLGPGTAFARETCPTADYALCAFVDRLPTDWIGFLFADADRGGIFGTVDVATQRELTAEQVSFALGTLTSRPLATLGGLALHGLQQLFVLNVDGVPITRQSAGFLRSSFPPELAARIESSGIYDHPAWAVRMTRLIEATSLISALILVTWAVTRTRNTLGPALYRLEGIVLVCVSGVVANALICGILASPYGRFQARIVWLLPMLALYILLTHSLRLAQTAAARPRHS